MSLSRLVVATVRLARGVSQSSWEGDAQKNPCAGAQGRWPTCLAKARYAASGRKSGIFGVSFIGHGIRAAFRIIDGTTCQLIRREVRVITDRPVAEGVCFDDVGVTAIEAFVVPRVVDDIGILLSMR